jgi:hypothetical protein
VYRFVGDVFGSGAVRPAEAELQRLEGVDPVVVDTVSARCMPSLSRQLFSFSLAYNAIAILQRLDLTSTFSCSSGEQILLVLRNLEDNLFAKNLRLGDVLTR